MLRSARNQIECAFGRRKARCAILNRKVDLKLENLPNLIYAYHICLVLHKRKRKVTSIKNWLKLRANLTNKMNGII